MVGSGRVIVPEMTAAQRSLSKTQRLTVHSGKWREFVHEFVHERLVKTPGLGHALLVTQPVTSNTSRFIGEFIGG